VSLNDRITASYAVSLLRSGSDISPALAPINLALGIQHERCREPMSTDAAVTLSKSRVDVEAWE